MPEMNLAFARPWTVRFPTLTRHMPSEYIDAFFQDGSLRLSSFDSFRKHPDEARRDAQEGLVAMIVNTPTGPFNILAANGQEAYILCASTVERVDSPVVPGKASAFRILDATKFADAVSRQIQGFVGGVEGLCSYRHNTMITKSDSRSIVPPTSAENVEKWADEMNHHTSRLVLDAYFMKHISFAHESEYRFIWFAEGRPKDFIDIKCPAAIPFCERI